MKEGRNYCFYLEGQGSWIECRGRKGCCVLILLQHCIQINYHNMLLLLQTESARPHKHRAKKKGSDSMLALEPRRSDDIQMMRMRKPSSFAMLLQPANARAQMPKLPVPPTPNTK
jgi:hypothetical protein